MGKDIRMLDYADGFAVHKGVHSVLVRDSEASLVPLVSIMIPTYRRPALLREAVNSALSQISDSPFEVVVVDNDNDSKMAMAVDEVIVSFSANNLRLFRNQENIGMFGNWNRCIELSRGRWISILNDDDMLSPDFLSSTLKVLLTRSDIKMVVCQTLMSDEREGQCLPFLRLFGQKIKRLIAASRRGDLELLSSEDYFLYNPHYGSLGILMERQSVVALGGFDPALYPSADFIFTTRFQLAYGAGHLKQVLATYRVKENESQNPNMALGWVQQSLKLRTELGEIIGCCPQLLQFYSRLFAIEIARSCSIFWRSDIDVDVILKQVGLKNRPVYVRLHLIRAFLTIVFWVRKRKKLHSINE